MLENQFSEEYRLFFLNNPMPMWVYDPGSLKFLAVNEAAILNYGYSRNEFLGMTIKDIRSPEDLPFLLRKLKNIPIKIERSSGLSHRKKDGTVIDVEITSHEIIFDGKKARFVLAVDVTETKKSILALQTEEERFRTLVEQSLVGIYIIQDGRFSYVNPRLAEIFGYTESEIVGTKTVSDLVAPNYRQKVNENLRKRLSGEIQSIRYRFRGVKKDGTLINVEVHGSKSDMDGKPSVLGTLLDITDSIILEREIKHRQKFEKLIAEVSSRFINIEDDEIDNSINESLRLVGNFFRVDRSYAFLYDSYNKNFRNMYMWPAYAEGQVTGQYDFINAEVFPWGVEKIVNFETLNISKISELPIEAEMEKNLLSLTGVKSLLAVPLVHKNNLEGILGFNSNYEEKKWTDEDISLLKLLGDIFINAIYRGRSQKLLKTSENKYRTLIETTNTGFVLLDEVGRIKDANEEYIRISGHKTLKQIVGREVAEWTAEYDRARNIQEVRKCLEQGYVRNLEIDYVDSKGHITPIEINASVMHTAEGTIIITLCRDITERKQALHKFKHGEERFRAMVQNSSDVITIHDANGLIVYATPSIERILGYKPEEMIGKNPLELVHPNDLELASFALEEAYQYQNKGIPTEFRLRHRNGSWIYLESLALNQLKNPAINGVILTSRDITQRRYAEEELRKGHSILRAMNEGTTNLIYIKDREGRVIMANPAMFQFLGKTESEVIGKNDLMFTVDTGQASSIMENDRRIMETKHTETAEESGVSHQGAWTILFTKSPYLDAEGNVAGLIGIGVDITERKRIEKNLHDSQKHLAALLHASTQPIMLIDTDGKVLAVNNAVADRFRLPFSEFIGKNAFQFLPPELAITRKERIDEVIRTGREIRFEDSRGNTFFDNSVFPVFDERGNVSAVAIFSNDMTEYKRTQQLLLESESQMRQVIDLVPHFIFAKNRKGQFIIANKAVADTYGTTVEDLIGKTDADFNPNTAEVEHFLQDDNEVIDHGIMKEIPEERISDSKGNIKYLHTVKIPFKMVASADEAILGVSTDITAKKNIEQALRESEEEYRTLAEAAHDMIFIIDMEGCIKYVNNFAARQFNLSPMEMIGEKRDKFFPLDTSNRQEASIQKAFNTAEPFYTEGKAIFSTNELWLGTWLVPLKNKSGKINSILGVSRDISAQKLAEEELERNNQLLKQQILELEISKQAVSTLLEEVTAKRDENLILLNGVKKRQQKLENLSRKLIQTEEQERKRFSQELHDSLGQVLTTLKINLDMAISSSGTQQPESDKYLQECRILTENVMYEVKQLSYALRPSVLDDFGLKAALRMLVTQTEKRINIPIELDLNIDDSRYDSTVETVMYRIVQESVTNIAKHSKATKAYVQLIRRGNILALSIIDNGIGLTKNNLDQGHELHFGLRNIRERVEFLGGKLYIDSKAGKGTEIIVEIDCRT